MLTLPARPSLEHLKKQAKRLHRAAQSGETDALRRIGPYFGDPATISRQQAQLVIARDYGFSSWTRLKRHIESGAGSEQTTEQHANRFLDLVCMHYGPDIGRGPAEFERAAALLAAHPEIAHHTLHTAAAAGDAKTVQRMLTDHPDEVDTKGGPFQWTPLMYAAYARPPGVSTYPAGKCLLEAGADPNAHYLSNGIYRFAVLTGIFGDGEGGPARQPPHPDMEAFARAALEAGANPNDSQGAYNRCFRPDDTHLKLMLEYGLKDDDPSDWWLTDPSHTAEEHRTLHFQLIIALRWGFADRARLLIEHGVDINTPDNNYYPTYTVGRTPYQVALMRGLPDIAELIKARGGSAEPLNAYESFQAACMRGDLTQAEALAPGHQGIDPARDRELLLEAAGNGHVAAVETMIALGFELNPRGARTPLHAAALNGHVEVIRRLVAAGADTTLRDPDYHSLPIAHARYNFQDAAAHLLMDYPMDVFATAALGSADQLRTLLDDHPEQVELAFRNVRTGPQDSVDNDWATPLWFAVVNGRADTAGILLERGANPLHENPDGRTILDFAQATENEQLISLLTRAGERWTRSP